jgi:hypothetical protein
VGHRRRDRADADPLADVEPLGELDDVGCEASPLEVGLGAGEDEDVPLPRRRLRIWRVGQVRRSGLPFSISSVGRRARKSKSWSPSNSTTRRPFPASCFAAVVAALPASTQPSSAATTTGAMSSAWGSLSR